MKMLRNKLNNRKKKSLRGAKRRGNLNLLGGYSGSPAAEDCHIATIGASLTADTIPKAIRAILDVD